MIEPEIDKRLCFIDSNIWLYAFINFQGADKSVVARSAMRNNDIAISTQVIKEAIPRNLLSDEDLPQSFRIPLYFVVK